MPARPAYFHRIADALEVFRQVASDWVDRRTVEETLGVSKTVAWRILRRCGGGDGPGNTLVCRRDALIDALERLQQTGEYEREIHRRERIESHLDRFLAAAHSQRVRLAPADRSLALLNTRFSKLPPGIELTPSRLVVEFSGTEDFLQKIGAVVFALQNDYDAVNVFISSSGGQLTHG